MSISYIKIPSGQPEQVSCPLMAWKANIDERSGRRLSQAVPSTVLQLLAGLAQAPVDYVLKMSRVYWSHYKLGHAPRVIVHTVNRSFPVPYTRQETALPHTAVDYVIMLCLSWILTLWLPKVVDLYLYETCPESRHSLAFRGVYEGIPIIVRTLRTPHGGTLAAEWSRLPGGRLLFPLPIPKYYGLFQMGKSHEMLLTSDNGVTLDRMDGPIPKHVA